MPAPARHPIVEKRSPSRVDRDDAWVGQGDVERGGPAAIDHDRRGQQRVEQRFDRWCRVTARDSGLGPDVRAHRFADGRGVEREAGRGRGHVKRQHRTGLVPVVEVTERAASCIDAVDDHRRHRFAGRGLEGRLPPFVDLDQIQQRAHDAVEPGKAFCSGMCARLVECLRQRVGPGQPRALLLLRGALPVDGSFVAMASVGQRGVEFIDLAPGDSEFTVELGPSVRCAPASAGQRPPLTATNSAAELVGLGSQAGHHAAVGGRLLVAGDRASPLGQHRSQATGPLPQRLHAADRVGEILGRE